MSQAVSRRDLLKWASAGAGAAAVGAGAWFIGRDEHDAGLTTSTGKSSSTTPGGGSGAPNATSPVVDAPPSALRANADPSQRLLVVVEMSGGNDGTSMIVPYGVGSYYDFRPSTATAAEDVLKIDEQVGYAKQLANLHRRGAAIVEGVGSFQPDQSHFEMMLRWWRGAPDNSEAFDTGFFGRLADAIGDPAAAAVAVSTHGGNHPALVAKKVGTLGLSTLGAARYLTGASSDDRNLSAFQRGMQAFANAGGDGYLGQLRGADGRAITFADSVSGLVDENGLRPDYPDNGFTRGLSLAMSLMLTGNGVRIIHVSMEGDFDTHENHVGRHAEMMARLDEGLEAFSNDLAANNLADKVLIMTTSEFGRRANDNGSGGLDHGTASNALLLGPVNPGRYGALPSFTDLADDNFKATVGLDQYYATIAESWFGVPASDVLNGNVRPLDGVIAL